MRKFFYNKNRDFLFSLELHKWLSPFWFYYGTSQYDNDNKIHIALIFFELRISWWTNFREYKYGFEFNRMYFSLYYWKNNYFWEWENNKTFRLWWWRIFDFFFWKELRLWGDEKYFWKYELIMDYWDRYMVKITWQQLYWWRSRWFGKKYWFSYELIPDRIIPYQWKWENSWDCWDDWTTSMTTGDAKTPEEALMKLKKSCEENRKKYWI